jgi:predicted RNA-binding protein with PIN domain
MFFMHTSYLIDGYNLLHALGVLQGKVGPGGLEQARLRLQGMLAGAFGDESHRVTLVFDAARAPAGADTEQVYKGLHILFAVEKQEADDLIEALLARHGNPRHVTVVSDDRRLKDAARRRQATPLGCLEFLDELGRIRRSTKAPAPLPSEKSEQAGPEEIKRWLEKFSGMQSDPALKEAFETFGFEDE